MNITNPPSTTRLRVATLAAGIALATTTFTANAQQQQQQQQQQNRSNSSPAPAADAANAQQPVPLLPAGLAPMPDVPAKEMEGALAAATEAATRDHGWRDLIGTLVAEDRRTLGTEIHQEYTALFNLADEFRDAWKKKYGAGDFNVEAGSLGPVRAAAGEVRDPAPLATNWPVDPGNLLGIAGQARATGLTEGLQARKAGPQREGERPARLGTGGREDPDQMKAGLQLGVVELPAAHGLPMVRVSLIKEQGGWKIDVPNYRTESLIRDDLMDQLRELLRTRDQWPADASDGTRMVTQRVMMAIYGIAPQQPPRRG